MKDAVKRMENKNRPAKRYLNVSTLLSSEPDKYRNYQRPMRDLLAAVSRIQRPDRRVTHEQIARNSHSFDEEVICLFELTPETIGMLPASIL
jgi:hypothetical protein